MLEFLPLELLLMIISNLSSFNVLKLRLLNQQFNYNIKSLIYLLPIKCLNKNMSDLSLFDQIKIIDLQMCRSIDDTSLKYLSNATTINLRGCNRITNKGISYLKNVKEVNIAGCYKINVKCFKFIENIKFLDISGFDKIISTNLLFFKNNPLIIISDYFCGGFEDKLFASKLDLKYNQIAFKKVNENKNKFFVFFEPIIKKNKLTPKFIYHSIKEKFELEKENELNNSIKNTKYDFID